MEKLRIGDVVRVNKPLDTSESPIWVKEMDYMDGREYTISGIQGTKDRLDVDGEFWTLNPKWCTPVKGNAVNSSLSELEKWKRISSCETIEELEEAIVSISDPTTGTLPGRSEECDANRMASRVKDVVQGNLPLDALTREYGILQQAMYLRYYILEEGLEG